MSNWLDLIEINIEEDKAYIKGTNVKVGDILRWLEAGQSLDPIVEAHPTLDRQAVEAAMSYRARFQYAKC
jgi:uncharacterized protein (DUF433 family)